MLRSFDLEYLGRTLDFVNIMTYDMGTGYSPISMFNQPLFRHPLDTSGDPLNSADAMVKLYQQQGVSADKLVFGTEFLLNRGFQVTDTVNNGLYRPWTATGCGTATMTNALRAGTSVLINWDPNVLSPYLWDPSQRRLCSFENAQSLGIRAEYAKAQGLAGMFTWELSGDTSGSQLRAIAKPFRPELVQAAPAPTVVGRSIGAVAGQPFTGEVALVTGSSAASLTAEINWGDGTHSAGVVTAISGGSGSPTDYSVTGTHTYATTGSYPITIATIDPDPINSRMVGGTASVGTVLPENQIVTAAVAGGALALSIPAATPIDLGAITLTGMDQIISGALNPATVTDARGTNGGWSVTGQVSDFQGAPAGVIPAANLGWRPTASVNPSGLNLVPNPLSAQIVHPGAIALPGTGLSTPHTLCLAAAGASAGQFTCGGALDLGVPSNTLAAAYSAVLTITLI